LIQRVGNTIDADAGREHNTAPTEIGLTRRNVMKRIMGCIVALALVAGAPLAAQQKDAELDKLVQQYVAAWNKADVKALTALYADNAMRTGPTDDVVVGKPAIAKYYEAGFATTQKGTTLTVTQGRTQTVSADVRVQEGTWESAGGKDGPQRGRYLNTLVRVGGAWRLAASWPSRTRRR
jgi:uncharacterized protein (TIGR02246 family)